MFLLKCVSGASGGPEIFKSISSRAQGMLWEEYQALGTMRRGPSHPGPPAFHRSGHSKGNYQHCTALRARRELSRCLCVFLYSALPTVRFLGESCNFFNVHELIDWFDYFQTCRILFGVVQCCYSDGTSNFRLHAVWMLGYFNSTFFMLLHWIIFVKKIYKLPSSVCFWQTMAYWSKSHTGVTYQ